MFVCMDASLKNVCTARLGITYTAYHLRSEKQTTPLRYGGTLLVAQLVEALRYKSEGRGFDSR